MRFTDLVILFWTAVVMAMAFAMMAGVPADYAFAHCTFGGVVGAAMAALSLNLLDRWFKHIKASGGAQ